MTPIEFGGDLARMDAALGALPNRPAVFALWPGEGDPYLSKTALLRRRLLRLLGQREKPSRLLNLRHAVRRIEYRLTGSVFESGVLLYELTRRHFPQSYLKRLNLRMPSYVNIALTSQFPRSRITTHLTRAPGLFFGPFRSRASAERFEGQFLDLFQMRRCQDDLAPSPEHPGCIYGEMGMCVRPCQLVVGPAEYRHEVARAVDFLRTGGRSLLEAIAHSRDRLSEEMMFEEAARQHKRLEKVQETLKLRDDLACDVERLNGVAVTQSVAANAVELWFVRDGAWVGSRPLDFEVQEGKPVSLDQKLRETFAAVEPRALTAGERREYLALLARWYYSTWRDGEWLAFENYQEIPYRKLVNAVSRVAHRATSLE
jgi:excinuclease UvrABC nuclease subunit